MNRVDIEYLFNIWVSSWRLTILIHTRRYLEKIETSTKEEYVPLLFGLEWVRLLPLTFLAWANGGSAPPYDIPQSGTSSRWSLPGWSTAGSCGSWYQRSASAIQWVTGRWSGLERDNATRWMKRFLDNIYRLQELTFTNGDKTPHIHTNYQIFEQTIIYKDVIRVRPIVTAW